ncbi:MAG: hypothetical protein HY304_06580 [candidate division Zixibacteria bacterium]|nr:hypothetical protein [candidate division Zixibacteria bacterium]
MNLDFLKRIGAMTVVVGVIVFAFVAVYYDARFATGILIGCVWGIANFAALTRFLTAVVSPSPANRRRAILLGAVKFPVLYLAGYLILRTRWFAPEALLSGFSLLFLVTLLKALGRAYLHLDDRSASSSTPDGIGSSARTPAVMSS